MSTDCYFDFSDGSTERFGDHGVAGGNVLSLIDWLRIIHLAQPEVTADLISALKLMFSGARRFLDDRLQEHPEYVYALYGLRMETLGDLVSAYEVAEIFSEHMGQRWSWRID